MIALRGFRFIDMIKAIRVCLRAQRLPLYFNRDINYLSDKEPSKMREIENYLSGVIDNDRYVKLLKSENEPAPLII